MDMKVCLVLVILGASWCCSARDLASSVPSTETVDIPGSSWVLEICDLWFDMVISACKVMGNFHSYNETSMKLAGPFI